MFDDLVLVTNTHAAMVAGVPPGARGTVARWVAEGPLGFYLRPVETVPTPPPLPPTASRKVWPEVKTERDENSHEARAKIRAATRYEEVVDYLEDPRKSVAEAAAKKARQIEGLEPEGE